jgi:diguanylate cyclase (GGDEF)-like protein
LRGRHADNFLVMEPTVHAWRIGLALVLSTCALVAASVWSLPATRADHVFACLLVACMGLAAIAWHGLSRTTAEPRLVLMFPLIVFGGLACLGTTTSPIAAPYGGVLILVFIYIGLCTPPGSTVVMVFPAALTMLFMNGLYTHEPLRSLEVREPISVVIWLTVGILLSTYSQATMRTAVSLRREVMRDPLTGLRNRRALDEILEAAGPGDVVVLIDLDHFKSVNDARGHAVGDDVLREFSRVTKRSIRDRDLAARYGGDEFLLYLPDTSLDAAEVVIARLRDAWAANDWSITFSAGLAPVRIGRDGTDAFGEADRFLYEAKSAGRDQSARQRITRIAVPQQRQPVDARVAMVAEAAS